MIRKLLERFILPHFKAEIIGGDCYEKYGPLMTRWVIVKRKRFAILIHKFHRSDLDRAFHDHPWHFITLLLTAGYWENTPKGRLWRRRFSVLFRPATWQHWVELEPLPVYTLVIRSQTVRDWGFIVNGVWQKWNTVDFEKVCKEEGQ